MIGRFRKVFISGAIALLICFICFGCSSLGRVCRQNELPLQRSWADPHDERNWQPAVSYLGPRGTYTQEACIRFFGKSADFVPHETVRGAIDSMSAGRCAYCVMPVENTIGGAVIDYVDALIGTAGAYVVGEVELPIRQNLLALEGSSLSGIRKVYSHKQGIAQSAEWLAQNLPHAEVIEVSSTAEGARLVSESADSSCAAIASAACAGVYSLDILAAGIQKNENNRTRFYVLANSDPMISEGDRIAFVATGKAEWLPDLMARMQLLGVGLVAIHDRPRKTELGWYDYLIEGFGCDRREYCELSSASQFEFRYLGIFDVV